MTLAFWLAAALLLYLLATHNWNPPSIAAEHYNPKTRFSFRSDGRLPAENNPELRARVRHNVDAVFKFIPRTGVFYVFQRIVEGTYGVTVSCISAFLVWYYFLSPLPENAQGQEQGAQAPAAAAAAPPNPRRR